MGDRGPQTPPAVPPTNGPGESAAGTNPFLPHPIPAPDKPSVTVFSKEMEEEYALPRPIGDVDLEKQAETLGIRYFLVSYAPLNTDARVACVPRAAIRNVQRDGCGVPAAMFYKADGSDPEMYVVPDPGSLVQLPWKPEYGWLSSNLYMRGRPFTQCARFALIKQIRELAALGYTLKAGVEPEFLLLTPEGSALGDWRDAQQPMSLQDPLSVMRTAAVTQKVCDYMEKLGWQPYEVDHEASCCQYEINFGFCDALTMADRYCFMKFMIKEVAELEGYRATFMPVPLPKLLCANGLHVNVSLWHVESDTNAFPSPASSASSSSSPSPAGGVGLGLSEAASHFIGGLLRHAKASCAVMCPTVNSYKRLNLGSWCPTTVCWGGNNRTVLLRVPANNRVEHRLPDGATNLYLALAVVLAAGRDGLQNARDPGEAVSVLITEHPNYEKYPKMPRNLLDALRAFKTSAYINDALGQDIVNGFVAMKEKEWEQYMAKITDWERDYYMNC